MAWLWLWRGAGLRNAEVAKYATGTLRHLASYGPNRDDMLADTQLVTALLELLVPQNPHKKLSYVPGMGRSPGGGGLKGVDPRLQHDAISTLSLLADTTRRKLTLLERPDMVPVLLQAAEGSGLRSSEHTRVSALKAMEDLLMLDGEMPVETQEKLTEKESIVRIVNILRVEEDQELLTSILRVVRLLSSKARAFKRLLVENEGLSILLQHAARLTVTRTNIPEDLGCVDQMISEVFVRAGRDRGGGAAGRDARHA